MWCVDGVVDVWGCPHTCAHIHMHTHTHTYTCYVKHYNFMQITWPPLGNPWESLECHRHVCMHASAHVCIHGAPPHTHTHIIPPISKGDPQISKNSISLELIKIFHFHLKIKNLYRLPIYGWVYGLVDGWTDGWVHVKSLNI